jgi:hypothetical protein
MGQVCQSLFFLNVSNIDRPLIDPVRNETRSFGLSHGCTQREERLMKYVLAIIAAASICAAVPASAEDVGVGVGVGPVGAGVTVGSDHRDRDRERTTVIKEREREPRETTVIKERDREPDRKVIIDRDRN